MKPKKTRKLAHFLRPRDRTSNGLFGCAGNFDGACAKLASRLDLFSRYEAIAAGDLSHLVSSGLRHLLFLGDSVTDGLRRQAECELAGSGTRIQFHQLKSSNYADEATTNQLYYK